MARSRPCGRGAAVIVSLTSVGFALARAAEPETGPPEAIVVAVPAGSRIAPAIRERLRGCYEAQLTSLCGILAAQPEVIGASAGSLLARRTAILRCLAEGRVSARRELASPALALDAVGIRNATEPRLTGRVLTVGPHGTFRELRQALAAVKPGDLVRLEEGSYSRGTGAAPKLTLVDVAIVGAGPEKTRLASLGEARLTRVRLGSLSIAGRDEALIDLEKGSTLALESCELAYGSNAVGVRCGGDRDSRAREPTTVLWVEGCRFDGKSRTRNQADGSAFQAREALVYARGTLFVDNHSIGLGAPSALDGCTCEGTKDHVALGTDGFSLTAGRHDELFLRRVELLGTCARAEAHYASAERFAHATDDPELVGLALGERASLDERSAHLVRALGLARNVPYWIGLLRSADADVRAAAASRVHALTGQTIAETAVVGSAGGSNLAGEVEQARLLSWFDEHEASLVWDEEAGHYRTAGKDDSPAAAEPIVLRFPRDAALDPATSALVRRTIGEGVARVLAGAGAGWDETRSTPLGKVLARRAAIDACLEASRLHANDALVDTEPLALDAAGIREQTAPRLTGRIVRVGPGTLLPDLQAALPRLRPGDLVALGPGTFSLAPDRAHPEGIVPLGDIAFVGSGPDTTKLQLAACRSTKGWRRFRLRLQGLTLETGTATDAAIACAIGRFGLHLRSCAIVYGSEAGQKEPPLHGRSFLVFAEGCTFEERPGNPRDRVPAAHFFDSCLYARRCDFLTDWLGTEGIPFVLDDCRVGTSKTAKRAAYLHPERFQYGAHDVGEGAIFVRRVPVGQVYAEASRFLTFPAASDDREVVEHALGRRPQIDAHAMAFAAVTSASRNLHYWIGLLRDDDPTVRQLAADRFEALTGERVAWNHRGAPTAASVAAAVRGLGASALEARDEASGELLAAGETARSALETAAESGTAEQRARALALLASLDVDRALGTPLREVEWARLSRWLEERGPDLAWDESHERYIAR